MVSPGIRVHWFRLSTNISFNPNRWCLSKKSITLHDILPLFSIFRSFSWDQVFQVTRLDIRQHGAVSDVLEVVCDKVDHGAAKLPELLLGCHPQLMLLFRVLNWDLNTAVKLKKIFTWIPRRQFSVLSGNNHKSEWRHYNAVSAEIKTKKAVSDRRCPYETLDWCLVQRLNLK